MAHFIIATFRLDAGPNGLGPITVTDLTERRFIGERWEADRRAKELADPRTGLHAEVEPA